MGAPGAGGRARSVVLTDVTIGGRADLGLLVQHLGVARSTNLTIVDITWVRATGEGGLPNGMQLSGIADLFLAGSTVAVPGFALDVGEISEASVEDSTIEGGRRAIDLSSGGSAYVWKSRVAGAVHADHAFLMRCVFAYDGNLTPLDATCQPPP